MRRGLSIGLCVAAQGISMGLGLASGLGVFVLGVVLIADGSIGIGPGLALMFIGTPVVGTILNFVALALGMPLMGLAYLLDGEVAAAWGRDSSHY